MNQPDAPPKILVAPLDWGLGHATRCIPLIRELLIYNCCIIIAASGKGKLLLQQEFPQLTYLTPPGYQIQYASTSWGLAIKIVAQIPKLLLVIKKEQAWLKKVVEENKIDAVISDNRYGLHHPAVRSVFITHQLCIKAPLKWVEGLLQKFNYRYINRFSECWVPDEEAETALAGELSHPKKKPGISLQYLGPLSRFQKGAVKAKGTYLLIMLSGPEPQRTLLEEILLNELKTYTDTVVFVRGLPDAAEPLAVARNVTVYNHLPAAELEQKIGGASIVISRCGYSTVMDMAALQKRSILIPTPGQTEQEYLAKHLMKKGFAFCVEQKKFRLKNALEIAETFPYQFTDRKESKLKPAVRSFIEGIRKNRKHDS